jgi:hypothetical protein
MLRSTPSPLTPEWLADRLAVSASQVAHPFIERADAQLCIRITGGEQLPADPSTAKSHALLGEDSVR